MKKQLELLRGEAKIVLVCVFFLAWHERVPVVGVSTCEFVETYRQLTRRTNPQISEEPQQLDQPNSQILAERKVSNSETIVTRVERLEKVRGAKRTA